MVAMQETLSSLLQKFGSEHKVKGSAVVTRDGLPLVSALPPSVNSETFAAMSATMMGAAETAASEVVTTSASVVMADFGTFRMVACPAGADLLVVTIAHDPHDLDSLAALTRDLAAQVRGSL